MAAANRDTPRNCPASTGSGTWNTSTDAVEFDALPDQPCAGQGAVHVERQHLGGQHLQLQGNSQAVLRPARPYADEDLARQKHLARRPALQAIEVGKAF